MYIDNNDQKGLVNDNDHDHDDNNINVSSNNYVKSRYDHVKHGDSINHTGIEKYDEEKW